VTTALPVIEREITALVTGFDAWVATAGYPLLKASLGNLWKALTTGPALPPGPPIEDIAGNIIPQKGSFGLFADGLNDAMTGLNTWAAGPGHQALMTAVNDLWTSFRDAMDKTFGNQDAAFPKWFDTTLVPWFEYLGSAIGAALGNGFKLAARGVVPPWLWSTLGLGDAPVGTSSTNQPTNVAGSPSGGGSPGDAEGGPAITGLGGPGGAPSVVYMTVNYNSPLTAADVAQAHSELLLAAMRDGLGDGGGISRTGSTAPA
jgi:hypothetical protein